MTDEEIRTYIEAKGKSACDAEAVLSGVSGLVKNRCLLAAAGEIEKCAESILEANETDIKNAVEKGMRPHMVDRLRLNGKRIADIALGIRQVAELTDPVGEIIEGNTRPNGLRILKTRVPLGVIGIIYESRPNVTADAAALCLKSGNACILRGGSEAINSNIAIVKCFKKALASQNLPEGCVEFIDNTSREVSKAMMRLDRYIDVLIPRGGAGLIKAVTTEATVPVIRTGTGNCHTYIDEGADLDMALSIIVNAKTQRPSVCNACETLLVNEKEAESFLPAAAKALLEKGTQLRVCEKTMDILRKCAISFAEGTVIPATEEDWDTEYDDLILAVKIVSSVDEAIEHIRRYTTHHSECIVTKDYNRGALFQKRIDAACVYVNASTRFTDGFEFGLGAEIGISNQKLHARGPMGLRELTTVKYLINGDGQVRG